MHTTPINMRTLAALLREQAPRRNAKRQPELIDIPGPALTKLAAALDGYADSLNEPALVLPLDDAQPELPAAPAVDTREAAAMVPITGSPALADHETINAAQDSIDLTKYGFRAPWPVPREPAELAEAFAHLALPLDVPPAPVLSPATESFLTGAEPVGTTVTVAGVEFTKHAQILGVGEVRLDLDGDDWLRDPGAYGPPGHPAESGHYDPGSQAYASGKDEAGVEPAYRLTRSVTQLTSYLECGLRYHARYVDRVPDAPSVWAAGGLAFHETARQFETARAMDDGLWSPDDAAKRFTVMLDAQVETQRERFPDVPVAQWRAANSGRETLSWWEDKGPEMAAQYVTHALKSGDRPLMLGNDAPALELKLAGPLGQTRVVGYLDHVAVNHAERTLKIKDYKTGSRLPTDPVQLITYGALLSLLPADLIPYGYEVRGEYWAARKGVVAGSRVITPPMLATTVQRFADFDRAERAGLYMAAPSAMVCAGCPIKATCPVMGSADGGSSTDSSALAFDA